MMKNFNSFVLSDKVYDFIKWVSSVLIPFGVGAAIAIDKVWNVGDIGISVGSILVVFIMSIILYISSVNYYKINKTIFIVDDLISTFYFNVQNMNLYFVPSFIVFFYFTAQYFNVPEFINITETLVIVFSFLGLIAGTQTTQNKSIINYFMESLSDFFSKNLSKK